MRIVVLAGGTSTEREVSIVSGTQVCKALRSKGHQAILVDVFFGDANLKAETAFADIYVVEAQAAKISSLNSQLESRKAVQREFFGENVLEICKAADVVFLALHGENGENGKVQAAFDLLGIRYTGSGYLGSALAMDKNLTKQLFRGNGVPTPAGFVMRKGDERKPFAEYEMALPCVVKACCGGSSVGVYIVQTEDAFWKALDDVFALEDTAVIEEYVKGREFSVGVVDGEAYPVIEIAPIEGFYDYKNKYQAGSTIETCPAELSAELTKEMQGYAELAYKVLGLENYGRIDILMDEEENMYCLEANTLPGMTPTSLLPQEAGALGMSYADLCEKLIEVSLRK